MDELKGREFRIAEQVAELLDSLPPEKQKQVMAMLATRYGLTIKEPASTAGKGYSPRPRKTRW